MKITNFIKKLGNIHNPLPAIEKEVEIEKNSLNEERFEDIRDPLVAERVTTRELRTFLQLYSSYPWVYIAANAIATAGASVPFQLLLKGQELEDADENAPYLNQPNPNMTWFELIETTFLHLELAGNAYWEVVRDKNTPGEDKILAIYPLRPDRMRIIPDSTKKIKEYEYMINTAENTIHFKPDEIIHLKYTDALSEYYGIPPIAAVKNEITLDFNATTWNKNFFVNGAEPGGVLETDKSLTPQAYERLRQNWYKRHKGANKAHEVAILEEGLKYRQITSKHADMQYYEMKAWCRDVVLSAMRVPPVILGISQKLSVGTERDQKKIFWYNNIIPKLTKIQHVINTYLMPEGIEFVFIIKAIDSVVEDDQVKTTIVQSNISHGVMTINEARKKYYGMDEVDWGDTWWRPVGLVDVENPIAVLPSPTGSPSGQGVTTGDRAGLSGPNKVPNVTPKGKPKDNKKKSILDSFIDIEKIEYPEPDWDNKESVRDYQEFSILKSHAGPDEKKLRNIMIQFFHEQSARILSKVEEGWQIKKDNSPSEQDYMDEQEENKLLYGAIIATLIGFYKKYGVLLMNELDPNQKFSTTKDGVRAWIENHAADMVTQINDTTRELIKNQLVQAYDAHESLDKVYARLSEVLTGDPSMWRVFKIARTELLTLTNNARLEAAKQSGVVQKKRWVCALLPTSRERVHGENHIVMHNTVVKFDEPFKAPRRGGGHDLMQTPGDVTAHPENRVNCLCYASFYSGTEEFKDINLGKKVEVAKTVVPTYDVEQLAKDLGVHISDEFKKMNDKTPDVNVTVNMPEGMIKQDLKFPEMPKIDVKVDNHVEIPKQDAPIVKIENQVNPTPVNIDVKASDVKAPDVNVTVKPSEVRIDKTEQIIHVNVPQQAAPIVNVDVKSPDIKAPIVNVNVNPELTVKPSVETTEVFRDNQNRITGSKKTVEPKE